MTVHASDCALHNAPAKAPEACSCGASMRFRLYGYDVGNDDFRWRTFSRETLVADAACNALAPVYANQRMVRPGTLIARAIKCGLTDSERHAVAEVWRGQWSDGPGSASRRQGNESHFSAEDGRYLNPLDYPDLTAVPEEAEIAEALAPWIEYWATLPEPVSA